MTLACPSGAQDPNWCPQTTADALPSVLGLLPPGPAWDGAAVAGSVQNQYWSAFANLLAYTYARLCLFVDEFYCHSVNESFEQWSQDYALDDPCDPFGGHLCAKVASQGGAKCADFVEAALAIGWVVTCTDVSREPEPVAGGFIVGCTMLGETPVFEPRGSNLGLGELYPCNYGEVVSHPDPLAWARDSIVTASCPIPGSNLGYGPDVLESCCFIVGFYEKKEPNVAIESMYCNGNQSDTIFFDCPSAFPMGDGSPRPATAGWYDKNDNYIQWGNAFIWRLTVDTAASRALQIATIPPPPVEPASYSAAGQFMVGAFPFENTDGQVGGSPLCAFGEALDAFSICALERIAPAHTLLTYEVHHT